MAVLQTARSITLDPECGICEGMWCYICPACDARLCKSHAEAHQNKVNGFREAIRDQLALEKERALRSPSGWVT